MVVLQFGFNLWCRGLPTISKQLPPLPAVLARPDAIPARSQDTLGIQSVLDLLMEPQQGLAVPGIRVHNLVG